MNYPTQEQITERYKNLPQDLKEAIGGVSSSEIISSIAKGHQLSTEQTGAMARETGLVILGFIPARDFIKNIATEVGVSENAAVSIATEINKRIFSPVRESLKKVHGLADDNIAIKPVAPSAPSPVPASPAPLATAPTPVPATPATNIPLPPKEELLKSIEGVTTTVPSSEKAAPNQEIPEIMQGPHIPMPFEAKTKEEIFHAPPQKTNHSAPAYPGGADPYREPI